jgi:hypothetical protein
MILASVMTGILVSVWWLYAPSFGIFPDPNPISEKVEEDGYRVKISTLTTIYYVDDYIIDMNKCASFALRNGDSVRVCGNYSVTTRDLLFFPL